MNWEDIKKRKFIILILSLTIFLVLIGDAGLVEFLPFFVVQSLPLYYFIFHLMKFRYIPAIDLLLALLLCVSWAGKLGWGTSSEFAPMLIYTRLYFIFLLAINLIIFVGKWIWWMIFESQTDKSSEKYTCAPLEPQRLGEVVALMEGGSLEFTTPAYAKAGAAVFMSGNELDAISESLSKRKITIWACEDEGKIVSVIGGRSGRIIFMSVVKEYYRDKMLWRLMSKMLLKICKHRYNG